VVHEIKFRDHHRYQENDFPVIAAARKAAGARYILTTGKDAVKLAAFRETATAPILVLETDFALEAGFFQALHDALAK
jgi:tetraacyldisaccharide-1-P 4'-kinase